MRTTVEAALTLGRLLRVDVALEGDWNATVTTIWDPASGFVGFDRVQREHPEFRPSLELYFDGFWVGLHCFERRDGLNVFDQAAAVDVIRIVETPRPTAPPP